MDKAKIIERYKDEDERLLVSKLLDKISLVDKYNKIQVTDFLSPVELRILKDVLNFANCRNYRIYGGVVDADRNAIVIFPDKLESLFVQERLEYSSETLLASERFDYNSIFGCIRISNCNENYEHKIYLGGCIKLGVKREKIGDIVVFENGADIIVSKDVEKFLVINLQELNRFRNAKVEVIKLSEITRKIQEFKDLKVVVSSLRLDNVVAELAGTSRNKALELLKQERVFVNYKNETKPTKLVVEKDLITVRGKGKFVIEKIEGNTRSGKVIVFVRKFV